MSFSKKKEGGGSQTGKTTKENTDPLKRKSREVKNVATPGKEDEFLFMALPLRQREREKKKDNGKDGQLDKRGKKKKERRGKKEGRDSLPSSR